MASHIRLTSRAAGAFNLALLATALTQQDEIEEACAIGAKATELAAGLRSTRNVRYILDLRRRLAPYAATAPVHQLNKRIAALTRARAELR